MGKKRIAIVTDSNSGITQQQGKEMGITVLPMPFYINEQLFLEDITLTQEEFYKRLEEGADISTSQPSPADVMELWETLLQSYEEVVHIPMSCGLSNSCQTAMVMAKEFKGRVHVVDNQRISVTQRQSVLDAVTLAEAGKNGAQIKEILEKEAHESSIYITLETLKYLKKGGRITPAAAALGTVLNLKPVLQIQGQRLDAFSKARGKKQAKKIMIKAMEKDLKTRFKEYTEKDLMCLEAAYAGNEEEAQAWKKELEKNFGVEVFMAPLSLSVACHIGQGALAVAAAKKVEVE